MIINTAVVNCADSRNIETCRSYNVRAFPTIKLFKAFSLENDTGSAIKLSHDLVLPGLLKGIFEHLEAHTSGEIPPSWPMLHPLLQLESIESLWDEPNQNHAHHLLIYEKPDSILGRQLILDTRNVKAVRTVRVLDTEDTRRLMQQKGAVSLPSVLLCFRSTRCRILSPGSTERADFLTALRSYHRPSYHKDLVSITTEDNSTKYKLPSESPSKTLYTRNAVYARDLESGIYYSLAMEAARQSILAGETLDALKAYCATLAKYLPGRPLLLDFLRKLNSWLQQANEELRPQMLTDFMKKEWEMTGLPTEIKWIGCRGSRPHYRGYPCGLWVLFHTLTVGAHKIVNRDRDTNADPKEVLFGIWSFVKYFFGCRECGKNFQKMAVEIGAYVNSTEDAVYWLWQAHNKVNKRLAGDISEDPQFPKVQFPPKEFCSKCRNAGLPNNWNKLEIFNFLLWLHADSIQLDEMNTQDSIRLPEQSNIKIVIPSHLKNWSTQ